MGPVLPLSMLPTGKHGLIRRIAEGEKFRGRLGAMGFIPGREIQVIRNDRGPLVVSVLGSQLALGRGMAHKIFVEELIV